MATHIVSPLTIMEWIIWLEVLSAIPQSRFEEAITHTVKVTLQDGKKHCPYLSNIAIFRYKIKKRKDARSKRLP